MNVIQRLFGHKGRVASIKAPVPRLTIKALTTQTKSVALQAYVDHLKANPKEALAMGRQLMGIHEEDYGQLLLREAADKDPEIKQQMIQAELRKQSLGSGDWMEQFMRNKEFFDMMGGGGNKSSNPITSLLENPQVAMMAMGIVDRLLNNAGAPVTTVVEERPVRRQVAAAGEAPATLEQVQDYIQEELDEAATPAAGILSTRAEILSFVDMLIQSIDRKVSPGDLALLVIDGFKELFQDYKAKKYPLDELDRVQNIILQDADEFAKVLGFIANVYGNKEYIRITQWLNSKDGLKYLEEFCMVRDELVKLHNDEAQKSAV